MKMTILGSGSAGNCYIIQNANEAIVIEAGIRFNDVKSVLGYNLIKVAACLVSHEHGDHAGYVADFLERCIPVYATKGTWDAMGASQSSFARICEPGTAFACGGFKILPFDTKHDAAQPCGFLISHPETGVILFATDTYYLPYRFEGLSHVMIECNYIRGILADNVRNGSVIGKVADRVRRSHMELGTCVEALKSNDLSQVRNIVLLHLSRKNGDPEEMRTSVVKATGKLVTVAKKDIEINFDKDI